MVSGVKEKRGSNIARRALVLLHVMCFFATAPSFGSVAIVKISGEMATGGNVDTYQIGPNGQWVVYKADQDTNNVGELYSVPIRPVGASRRLNAPLTIGRSVRNGYEISLDGTRVVYRADQDTEEVVELYSVAIEEPEGSGVKLNGTLPPDGDVSFFKISPDGARVVYQADQERDGISELYSVPLTGPSSAAVKLNQPFAGAGIENGHFFISPDSSRVVYIAEQVTSGVREIFSVPIEGPASAGIRLNGPLAASDGVHIGNSHYALSPDGSWLVYRAEKDIAGVDELYSIRLTGPTGSEVKLNRPLVSGGEVAGVFRISPDSSRVVYRADQETDDVFELYTVRIDGPSTVGVKISGPMTTNGGVISSMISLDSSRVVYLADQDTDEVHELCSVPINGPAALGLKLNGPLVAGGDVNGLGLSISPNGLFTVYIADQITDESRELFSVPTAGPAGVYALLSIFLGATGDVQSFQITPDSSHVIYEVYVVSTGFDALFRVPITGPNVPALRFSDTLTTGGSIQSFQIAPDSHRVVYKADQEVDQRPELFLSYERPPAVRMWAGYE